MIRGPVETHPTSGVITADLIVIGGGIIGGAVARDAALRGLRVILIEQDDFGAGTSNASSRLIHGGLRYLEQFDLALVRQDLAERERLLHLAPHLVRPLPFLVPLYRKSRLYQLKLRAGLTLYDLLAFDRSLPGHRLLSPEAARARVPALAEEGLAGAALYYDAQVALTERLCVEQIVAATAAGASVFNHSRVTALLRDAAGAVVGVSVHDELAGRQWDCRASIVINATGPWLDELLDLIEPDHRPLLRRTKGIHLVMPAMSDDALVLFAEQDGRLFFVIPWLGFAYVGTTDTDFSGDPGQAAADSEDVEYLLKAVQAFLPAIRGQPVFYTTAGVRALVRRTDVATSAVSRRHRLLDHAERGAPGLLSIVGGKLTAHRGIAEEAVDLACRRLGIVAPGTTRQRPLPGAIEYGPTTLPQATREAAARGLDSAQSQHLVELYGSRYGEILELIIDRPRLAARLDPGGPACLAQVHHAVQREQARTLSDVLLRRLTVGLMANPSLAGARLAAAEMAELLGWDEARQLAELTTYQAGLTRRHPVSPLEGVSSRPEERWAR